MPVYCKYDSVKRMIRCLAIARLSAKNPVQIERLSRLYYVSPRTIERDIWALRAAGYNLKPCSKGWWGRI